MGDPPVPPVEDAGAQDPWPAEPRPRVRIALRSKILLGMIGTVLAALVPTALVVNDWLTKSVDRKIEQDFGRARITFSQFKSFTDSLLVHEARALGEDPVLTAAIARGDQAGVREALGYGSLSLVTWDLYAVVRADGEAIVSGGALGAGVRGEMAKFIDAALLGGAPQGAVALDGIVYEAVARPLFQDGRIAGAAFIGDRVDTDLMETLRAMSGSEIALMVDDRLTLCTLDPEQKVSLEDWLRGPGLGPPERPVALRSLTTTNVPAPVGLAVPVPVIPLSLAGERHVCASIPVLDPNGKRIGEFFLFQSVDRAIGFFDTLRHTIFLIGAVAGSLAILFAMVIARGVTRNVRELVHGVREVERGNYDLPISARTRDEIGYLASAFNEMRVSLQRQMIQSRWLTEVVRLRNMKLEETLQELRKTQAELVKSERLAVATRLFAQLSHELNNPIYNIQTCVEVLRKHTASSDPNRQYIDLVYDEVLRMGRLTHQMLGFAKPQRDDMVATDLNRVVSDLLQFSERWLQENGIRVETRLAENLPRILASADQLRQVFLNLIINASDAMPEGGVIMIETEAVDGTARARVRDTGCGISRENQSKIFDAFFTTKGAMRGAGLGLSISYGIVKRHKGRIEVESEPGRGSCFTITIPVPSAAPDRSA